MRETREQSENARNGGAQTGAHLPRWLRYRRHAESAPRHPDAPQCSRLYVMVCRSFVKVGLAKRLPERLSSVRTSCPFEVSVFISFRVAMELASYAEYIAHLSLSDAHVRGEWFDCSPQRARGVVMAAAARAREIPPSWVRAGGDPRRWEFGRELSSRCLRLADEMMGVPRKIEKSEAISVRYGERRERSG